MNIFKAIAAIWKDKVDEKVDRVLTGSDISEPVFMMLRSIKLHPKQWRVELDLPKYDERDVRGMMRRSYNSTGSVRVRITDRIVGECYEASLLVDQRVLDHLVYDKALHRFSKLDEDYSSLCISHVVDAPEWLTRPEERELRHALGKLMFERLTKIIAYKDREKIRRENEALVRAMKRRNEERQRLVTLYGAHKDD